MAVLWFCFIFTLKFISNSNLVPRVSLLPFLGVGEEGREEERPWERGCSNRRLVWVFAVCPTHQAKIFFKTFWQGLQRTSMTLNTHEINESFSFNYFMHIFKSPLFHQWHSSSTPYINTHSPQSLHSPWQRANARNASFAIFFTMEIWYQLVIRIEASTQ